VTLNFTSANISSVKQVEAGLYHTLILDDKGRLFCKYYKVATAVINAYHQLIVFMLPPKKKPKSHG